MADGERGAGGGVVHEGGGEGGLLPCFPLATAAAAPDARLMLRAPCYSMLHACMCRR